jgi:hypothetical protein
MSNKVEYVSDTLNEYQQKDCISLSDIHAFLQSPRVYFYSKNKSTEDPEKSTFSLSIAIYEYLNNRELFSEDFIVSPKFNKRTKDGREQYEKFVEQAVGKSVISQEEMDMIIQTSVCVSQSPTLVGLMVDSKYEVSAYLQDKTSGLEVKLRPNIIDKTEKTVVEVIECFDASPKQFSKYVEEYDYAINAAYSMDFLGVKKYIFAAIEKKPPYQVSLYELPPKSIKDGRSKYRMALDLMKWSFANNFWCDYVQFDWLKNLYVKKQLAEFDFLAAKAFPETVTIKNI